MNPSHPHRTTPTTIRALGLSVVALLVVASLALAAPPREAAKAGKDTDTVLDTLLTAASEATGNVGSADVSVEGRGETRVRLTNLDELLSQVPSLDEALADFPTERPEVPLVPETPAFTPPALPPVDCSRLSEEQCSALKDARKAVEEDLGTNAAPQAGFDPAVIREEMQQQQAAARTQIEEQLAAAQEELKQKMSEIPREFSCVLTFSGSGKLTIPGGADISGAADVKCDPAATNGSGGFHVVLGHDGTYVDNGNGTFSPPNGSHDMGSLVASSEDLAKLLDGAQGTEDEGTEIIDGVETRHLSFTAASPNGEGSVKAEVWIGVRDHIVRKAVTRSSGHVVRDGAEVDWSAEQTILVTNVNVSEGEVTIPERDQIVPPPSQDPIDRLVNPFGGSIPSGYSG